MTKEGFAEWLDKLKTAWETRNPQEAADLCAENVLYFETPFKEPLKTKEEVLQEWQSVLNQENIIFSYEVLGIYDSWGIAHWTAEFARLPKKEKAKLDGIFKISLNKDNLCTEFHQWWNSEA